MESIIVKDRYDSRAIFIHHDTKMLNSKARFAISLCERWALVSARTEGETSDGSSTKIVSLNPTEIAKRSCNIAEAIFKEFDDRGWVFEVDEYEVAMKKLEEQKEKVRS
ncbi:MAG: hypothetical protein ACE5GN_03040 [Waddliaceae bacterium]